MRLFWIMLAGGLGALARYGLTLAVQNWLRRGGRLAGLGGADFPLGTLLINVSGAFLLAIVVTLVAGRVLDPELRFIVGTGFLGAYTTFSTFEVDAHDLLARGAWLPASLYIGGNLLLGFAAVVAGRALALRLIVAGGGNT